MVKKASWEKFCPSRINFPFGYSCGIRIVSQKYINKLAKSPVWGLSLDFGGDAEIPLFPKAARIYLTRDMDKERFIETLRHEMDHIWTEYKLQLFEELQERE